MRRSSSRKRRKSAGGKSKSARTKRSANVMKNPIATRKNASVKGRNWKHGERNETQNVRGERRRKSGNGEMNRITITMR